MFKPKHNCSSHIADLNIVNTVPIALRSCGTANESAQYCTLFIVPLFFINRLLASLPAVPSPVRP